MITEFTVVHHAFGNVDVVRQFDGEAYFWDLFDDAGDCLNEGDAFYTKPTEREVKEYLTRSLLSQE
jgi:hypothetical protein